MSFETERRFVADASHELRTPLAVVRAETDLALRRPRSTEEYRDAFRLGRRRGRSTRSVGRRLCSIRCATARPCAASRSTSERSSNASPSPLAARPFVILRVDRAKSEHVVLAHPQSIERAATAVLHNALTHGGAGSIDIRVRDDARGRSHRRRRRRSGLCERSARSRDRTLLESGFRSFARRYGTRPVDRACARRSARRHACARQCAGARRDRHPRRTARLVGLFFVLVVLLVVVLFFVVRRTSSSSSSSGDISSTAAWISRYIAAISRPSSCPLRSELTSLSHWSSAAIVRFIAITSFVGASNFKIHHVLQRTQIRVKDR